MTSMDNPSGGGNEEDLEDGEIFDDEEPAPEPVLPVHKPLMPPGFADIESNGPKRLSPEGFSPDRLRNNVKERKSFEGRTERRNNDRGGRSAPPRRHKRGRDSEEEVGKPPKTKMRRTSDAKKSGSAGEDEVDENEMIYVMGGNSPAPNKNADWESRCSDEEAEQPSIRGRRGTGTSRRAFEGSRTIRRSRFTRGGKARNTRKPDHRNEFTLCKFYMAGNCQRGKDCPFSHDASPPKRMELCKFYMNDCCNKKDKCLYMHQEFPCKFFHSGLKCYAGKRCKYSHGKINNYLRQALNKHLEQCDLREEHERMKDMFERKERGFERHSRFSDRDDRRRSTSMEREEDGHTPMPSPQPNHFSDREGGSQSPGDRSDRLRDDGFRNDNFRNDHSLKGRDNRRNPRCRKRRHNFDSRNDEGSYYNDFEPPHQSMDHPNMDFGDDAHMHDKKMGGNFYNEDEGKAQDNSENLPANMPRTQRELYMRIQQQMKKSESKTKEDTGKEDDFREENWYSSDEESGGTSGGLVNNPLKIIFSNVPGLQKTNEQSNLEDGKHKPNPQLFPDIDVNAVTKLLSSIRESVQKKKDEEQEQKKVEEESVPPEIANVPQTQSSTSINSPDEKRGLRDPRIRGTPNQMVLTAADLDLRTTSPPRTIESPTATPIDVDLRSLPFKPAPVHEAATEINASISSGPPIEWSLKVLPPIGPDYKLITSRLSAQFCLNDPRLKTHIQPQVLAQTQQAMIGSGGLLPLPRLGMSSPPMNPIVATVMPMPPMPLIPGGPPLIPPAMQMMHPGGSMPSGGPLPSAGGGPAGIRDPRQRHSSGDSKPPLINDPRRKAKGPEIEDSDLRNLSQIPMQFRAVSDTDLRMSAHPQAFYK